MKYKRGSLVEIFVQNEFRNHSWRCGQILSGKGGNYTVSYDVYPGFTNKDDVERISVKSIRPCPPLLEISESWVPGDVVEVFHNLSWNMAVILNDFGLDLYQVRLVGSSQELEVTKSELRVRQSYQNDEWIVIGKVTMDTKGDSYKKDICDDTQNNHRLMDSHGVSCKTLKRASPYSYSQGEKKFRKESRCVQVKENINSYGSESLRSLTSSCGSCSDNSYKGYDKYSGSGFVEHIEAHESDAESVCQFEYSEETDQVQSPTNEGVADEIHKIELHAYRCTMEALHASGPLTWEKESMVTNLRMSLHISNDEHLTMLKNLISAASNTLVR